MKRSNAPPRSTKQAPKKKPPASHRSPGRGKRPAMPAGPSKGQAKPKAAAKAPDAELGPTSKARLVALAKSVREFAAQAEGLKGERHKAKGELSETETAIHKLSEEAKDTDARTLKQELVGLEADRKRKVAILEDVEQRLTAAKEGKKGATADLFTFIDSIAAGGDLFQRAHEEAKAATGGSTTGPGQMKPGSAPPGSPAVPGDGDGGAWRGKDVAVLKPYGITDALLEKLYAADIRTMGDLADKTASNFDKVKGIGATSREKLSDATVGYFKDHPLPRAGEAPATDAKAPASPPLKGGLDSTEKRPTEVEPAARDDDDEDHQLHDSIDLDAKGDSDE